MKTDLQQSKCNGREVKIGIANSSFIAKIKVSESRKSQFHHDCLKLSKLMERRPLR